MAEIDHQLSAAAERGMRLAVHAQRQPDSLAIWSKFGQRTFAELNAGSNRLVRGLRRIGFEAGNGIALLSRNRPEFVETYQASLRSGGRMTPINWHLTPEEVSYIVCNSEALVLIADAYYADSALQAAADSPHLKLKVSVGGEIEGFVPWQEVVGGEDGSDIEDPTLGISMLYTSGTTGHPKGVVRKPTGTPSPLQLRLSETAAFNPGTDVSLVTGPLYHAAPLSLNLVWPLAAGLGCILMDRWDAEETLELIDRFSCTHTHMVATMFHRILKLPPEVRERYDLSSMRWILHGAAPTPVHVKAAIIDWLGPVVYEYYAATEGGSHFVTSEQWLEKPGSVGPICDGNESKIVDGDGNEVAQGESGTVYFKAPEEGRFEYFRAPEKTASAYLGDWFTMGDMGYLDADGYLFLNGRSAETIISGGVNIYPQEIDDVINQHPAIHEVCTIGVPSDEWGESVKSVIELAEGYEESEQLAEELLAWCSEHLPRYKRPRSIDFTRDLPRLPTGKIQRHRVRAPYWEETGRSI